MKKTGRKLFALLLALVLAVSILSTSAFAITQSYDGQWFSTGGYDKDGVDSCFEEIIEVTNDKIATFATFAYDDPSGRKYLKKDDETKSSGVITIINPDENVQDACKKIVGSLMNELLEAAKASEAIKEIRPNSELSTLPTTCVGDPGSCLSEEGGLMFPSGSGAKTAPPFDEGTTIFKFCENLGLLKGSQDGTLRDLDGQAFAFDILKTGSAYTAPEKITYVFTFKLPKLELEDSTSDGVQIEGENLTGDGLMATGNQAKTVEEVKEMFKETTLGGAEVKIYKEGGKEEVTDSAVTVGTGYVVELVANGHVLNSVVVIITGDTDGDGLINNKDAQQVLDSIVKEFNLDGVHLKAATMLSEEENVSHLAAQMMLEKAVKV